MLSVGQAFVIILVIHNAAALYRLLPFPNVYIFTGQDRPDCRPSLVYTVEYAANWDLNSQNTQNDLWFQAVT